MLNTQHKTILAFDYGLKKIGVAIGQTVTNTARPLCIIKAKDGKPNQQQLTEVISSWRPNIIVIGMPYQEDGTEQEITKLTRKFADNLKKQYQDKYKFTIETIDERHTSIEAKKKFAELRAQGLIKQGEKLDHIAACIILERWFNNIKNI